MLKKVIKKKGIVYVRLSDDDRDLLDSWCGELQTTRSEFLRQLFRLFGARLYKMAKKMEDESNIE